MRQGLQCALIQCIILHNKIILRPPLKTTRVSPICIYLVFDGLDPNKKLISVDYRLSLCREMHSAHNAVVQPLFTQELQFLEFLVIF